MSGYLRIMILIGSYKRCCLMNLRYIIVERMDVKIEDT